MAGTNIEDRFSEIEDKISKRQFQNRAVAGRKVIERNQKNEYTRANKSGEGLCFICEEYKGVIATLVDTCYRCAEKRNKRAVMAVASKSPYGYCLIHRGFPKYEFRFNLAQLNVRLCHKCSLVIARGNKEIRAKGMHNIDPFWLKMRRQFGKTYEMEFFPEEFSTRAYRK